MHALTADRPCTGTSDGSSEDLLAVQMTRAQRDKLLSLAAAVYLRQREAVATLHPASTSTRRLLQADMDLLNGACRSLEQAR